MTKIQRIVLTGGPCTGKTTLIDALKKMGHSIFPEMARVVIKEQLDLGTNKVPWDDVTAFSEIVLERQKSHFNDSAPGLNFFDRGIPDLMGYLYKGGFSIFSSLKEAAQQNRYDQIFLLPPWEEIYVTDNERREPFSDAIDIYHNLKKAYQELNYDIIEIPKVSAEERLNFILRKSAS